MRSVRPFALGLVALIGLTAAPAHAGHCGGLSIGVGFGFPFFWGGPCYNYYRPYPIYYAPPPVIVQPAPVYQPVQVVQPVYQAPAPTPPPPLAPVAVTPAPVAD